MSIEASGRRFLLLGWVICILAALFYCYEYLLRIEPSVMVSSLMESFHTDAGALALVVAMYYYAYTPLQALVGVLTDRYGPRIVLIVALTFCILGAYVFGFSRNLWLAGLGRFLIGTGSAFAFVGVLKLAAIWLPERLFPIFTGLTTSLGMMGAMYGDIELTRIVQHFGWHRVMNLSVVLGIVLFVSFVILLRDKTVSVKTVQHTIGWRKLFMDFIRLLNRPQLWIAGSVGCILYLSLTVVAEMWGIPFLQALHPARPDLAAKLNAMIFFGWLLGSPLVGWFSNKIQSRRLPMIWGAFFASFFMLLVIIFTPTNPVIMGALLFLFGLFSSAEILCFVIARERVSVQLVATAIGFVNLLVMLGGMVIQPIVGWLIDLLWEGGVSKGIHVYTVHNYRDALFIVPTLMLIGGIIAIFMEESYALPRLDSAQNYQRMRWKCRRGMLELDLWLNDILDKHYALMDAQEKASFDILLKANDQELISWFLKETKPHNAEMAVFLAKYL